MNSCLAGSSVTSGYLEDCSIDFAEGLTCIIGARGTCKSTLIESIRFAFDYDQERVKQLVDKNINQNMPFEGLIKETLGNGTIRCKLIVTDNIEKKDFIIEREIGSDPRIYRDDVREYENKNILNKMEIYSQGDLQRIAENDKERLKLIDRPYFTVINKLKTDRKKYADELKEIGLELRATRSEISRFRNEMKPLIGLREQLTQLQKDRPQLSTEMGEQRLLFQKRNISVNAIQDSLIVKNEASIYLSKINEYINKFDSQINKILNLGMEDTLEFVGSLNKSCDILKKVIFLNEELTNIDINQHLIKLKELFDQKNEPYFRLLQKEQEINDVLKREDNLRRQIEHMEKIEIELLALISKENKLCLDRENKRAEISNKTDEIFNIRLGQVEDINKEHGEVVFLTLESGSHSQEYIRKIGELLSGSRIRSQEDVANDLAKQLSSSELIDIIESGDAQKLSSILNRDLGQMTRVISHLSDHEDLYDIEINIPEDNLEITMYDKGIPKPVETLSKGQKATALLPLILRPLPYPLLFDQPEDDLDNRFIYKSLVQAINNLKNERQLIFVTHNANIPVLGDADKIIVMSMKHPKSANPPIYGNVEERKEDILNFLEGGPEAFEERRHRYGLLVS